MQMLIRLALILAAGFLSLPAFASGPNVVAAIKPVHALVASVMQGVGEPHLLVEGNASPHTFSLKPSGAQALENADLVFWIGPDLEVFLVDPLQTLAPNANIVSLANARNVTTRPLREGGDFELHDHEEDSSGHRHNEIDMHIWLDPKNALAMVDEIALALGAADPDNAKIYAANAIQTSRAIDALVDEITALLAPVQDRPFIVFHDAYQYFETRFAVNAVGSITVSPETIPGVRRVEQIRETVKNAGAACVFAEPQFTPRLVAVVTEGTNARAGVLDPMGAEIASGSELYFELLRNLAHSMKECLSH